MPIVLSSGGTGGHIYPLLALAESLGRLAPEGGAPASLLLVGTRTGLESRIFAESGLPAEYLSARPLPARMGLRWVGAAVSIARGMLEARSLLNRLQPSVAVGIGGYASVCVLRVAQRLGIATHIHENDSKPGRANLSLARRATSVSAGFAGALEAMGRSDGLATGNPVRAEFLAADGSRARRRLGLRADEPLVLVTGGSRGAVALNRAALRAAPRVAGLARTVLVTGRGNLAECSEEAGRLPAEARRRVTLLEYVDEGMADLMAAASLVVARAGAQTVFELAAVGAASVLVPYPFATQLHQHTNAEAFRAAGGARVLDQTEAVRPGALADTIAGLLGDPAALEALRSGARGFARTDASDRIARAVLETARRGRVPRDA